MKRVLCISDSLGLPRPGVSYSQTWLSILRERVRDVDFIGLFRRNGTTDMLSDSDYGEYLRFYEAAEVILQLGICDCSPRYMRRTLLSYRLINKLPGTAQTLFWNTYKQFVKRSLDRTDVPIDRFRRNVENYLRQCETCGVERVIIIKIVTPGPAMLRNNPLAAQAVRLYNAVYDELACQYSFVHIINPLHISDDSYYVDGYHANEAGNLNVANAIVEFYR